MAMFAAWSTVMSAGSATVIEMPRAKLKMKSQNKLPFGVREYAFPLPHRKERSFQPFDKHGQTDIHQTRSQQNLTHSRQRFSNNHKLKKR